MLQVLGILSGIVGVICYLPYVRDILLRKTKPKRASWLIWTVLGGISFFSQLAKGASNSLWMIGVQTFMVALIFIMTIKFGTGGLSSKDLKALGIALLGLLIWSFTKEAAWALLIVIVVDAVGALLTISKAYKDPSSETMSTWFLLGLSGLIAAFSVGSWNFILLSYPVYFWLINWAVVVVMKSSPTPSAN